MIHHGQANPSRRTELMIELMDYLDERFSLDLILVGGGRYLEKLHRLALRKKNVKIIPPVPMKDIIPFINQYEVGLYLAQELNKLTPERIMDLKQKSHQAAMQLNAEVNGKRIHEIIKDLVGNNI